MKRIILFLCSIMLISACSYEVFKSNTTNSDFSTFKTFAFLPTEESAKYDDHVIKFRSMELIEEELKTRGFTLNLDSPDFLVVVRTFFAARTVPVEGTGYTSSTEGFGVRFYFNGPSLVLPQNNIPDINYAPGTIAIEVLDAFNGALMWNAWSEQPIRESALSEELEEYIGLLFGEFPVKPLVNIKE